VSIFLTKAQYSPDQQREIDSLNNLLEKTKEDTSRIELRFQIGEVGWIFRTSYWDSISNDCIELLGQPNLTNQEVNAYRRSLGATFNNTGFIYNNQGNVSQALKYFYRSLGIYEKLDDDKGIARASNNIGLIYHEQGNLSQALKYYHKALKIREKIGNKRGIANSLNNLAFIYESQQNVPMALVYLRRSRDLHRELGNKQGIASSSNSIGVIQQRQGDIDEAKQLHEEAMEIQEEIGDKDGLAHSLSNLAKIALIQKDVKKASVFANRSLKISKELGFPSPISNASKLLSDIAEKEGNYKEGWNHYKVFIKMRDSARSQETEKAVLEQEMRNEYEKIALKDSIEDAQLQAVKDLKIKEQKATIKQKQTQNYALYGGLLLAIGVVVISIKAYQQKKKDNLLINEQKAEVEEKNQEITDSITYAKRIQQAILPPSSQLNKHLKNGFVLYSPKDIVAGDFYWMEVMDNVVYYAAADCTGHGVPGAMVSVVCHGALNRAVREFGLKKPADILNKVREMVIETFEQGKEDVKDGMDIALCAINFSSNRMSYAGANNSLYLIRDGELNEVKADKQPIGIYLTSDSFTNHEIELQEGDSIYVFTDGYADQFGGPKGKKFKRDPFKKLLLNNHDKPMDEQKKILRQTFENWKGDLDQVDDVCVIGVRI
jgi:serine phosphatase RsbU (regulator of sigma subunit)